MTPTLLESMAGCALELKQPNIALALVLGFYGLLRTGEICNLCRQDFAISTSPKVLVVNLGLTKGGARQGAMEAVTIDKVLVVNLAAAWCLDRPPGDKLLPMGGPHFRNIFNQCVRKIGLVEWGFRPYSLRRGGATEHFRRFNSLSATVVKGRWASEKMTRIYLNDGLATLASFAFPHCQREIDKYQKHFLSKSLMASS